MAWQPAHSATCLRGKACSIHAPCSTTSLPQCRARQVCAAAGRRGAQRGSRPAPVLEQHSSPGGPPPREASWESALVGPGDQPPPSLDAGHGKALRGDAEAGAWPSTPVSSFEWW